MLRLCVVVPTFNEVGNVTELRDRVALALAGIDRERIFVDDDSPDGTPATLREMAQSDRRVTCIQRIARRGIASACIEGVLVTSTPVGRLMSSANASQARACSTRMWPGSISS